MQISKAPFSSNCTVISRHPGVDVAAAQESGVCGDVSRRLHGAHDCVRLRRVSTQVSGDAVQPWEESGQRFHRYELDKEV